MVAEVPEGRGQLLPLQSALHQALDEEARRSQVLPAGHTICHPHQHPEHGHRVPQPGSETLVFRAPAGLNGESRRLIDVTESSGTFELSLALKLIYSFDQLVRASAISPTSTCLFKSPAFLYIVGALCRIVFSSRLAFLICFKAVFNLRADYIMETLEANIPMRTLIKTL
jgi:hypothetical protein